MVAAVLIQPLSSSSGTKVAVRKESGKNMKPAPCVAAALPVRSAMPTVKPAKPSPVSSDSSISSSTPGTPVSGRRPSTTATPITSSV